MATEWKQLLAGSDGFLTGGRRGLDGHSIAWGEMDTFVSSPRRWIVSELLGGSEENKQERD